MRPAQAGPDPGTAFFAPPYPEDGIEPARNAGYRGSVRKIVYTDLDGTLLDLHTYSFDPAKAALESLKKEGVPLVFCTSKTRAEVEFWRAQLDNQHPFIVENGGAIFVPRGYFRFRCPNSRIDGDYEVIEFGAPYRELVSLLRRASGESGCRVLGFHQMSVAEIAIRSLLPVFLAERAKVRAYDEPFEVVEDGAHRLLNVIERQGKRWTRGNRFYHLTGMHDKAMAAQVLTRLYRRAFGEVATVGIGDTESDARYLNTVDTPILVRSRFSSHLQDSVRRGQVTQWPGPYGWNEAVLGVLQATA